MLCSGVWLSLVLTVFREQLRRVPNARACCKHWLLNLKQVLELLYESQILSTFSLWMHETPVLRHRKHFTSESFCLVVLTSPSIYLSPRHCHDRLILAGVLSCCYNPKTKSCLPATMPATVSVLGDLKLGQFTSLWPVGWMDLFYLEFKSRSWSFFVVTVLTNSSFASTKEGLTDVAAQQSTTLLNLLLTRSDFLPVQVNPEWDRVGQHKCFLPVWQPHWAIFWENCILYGLDTVWTGAIILVKPLVCRWGLTGARGCTEW